MKKILFLIPLLFILTGCGSNIIECTLNTPDSVKDLKLEAKYTVYKDGKYVKTATSIEKITSEDIDSLKELEQQAKDKYKEYNDKYKGYVYTSSIDGNTLESKVVINYDIMDYDKYVEDYPAMKQYTENGRLTVEGAKAMYKLLGAECK